MVRLVQSVSPGTVTDQVNIHGRQAIEVEEEKSAVDRCLEIIAEGLYW